MKKTEKISFLIDSLAKRYPSPKAALDWRTPWELLVATILSAQCTDERVNKVTPPLFERFPDVYAYVDADVLELEKFVHSTGFFRNKAKNIQLAARRIVEVHNGEVPQTMEEMLALAGAARKTANVVLSNAYGIDLGIAVDTHVKRIAYRLGFTQSDNPIIIEKDLLALFPQDKWGAVNHYMVFFGREVCHSRSPECTICELIAICPQKGITKTK